MIRPTEPGDSPALIEIARGTGVFKPFEIVALGEVFDDYYAFERQHGHQSILIEAEGRPQGFAYYAPAAMTDRAWYLYWIAVESGTQAKGLGSALLHRAEDEIRALQGRLFLIETSSLPHYDLTRRFYLKQGYEQAARIKDFYADGDDLVVFSKRLLPPAGDA